MSDAVLKAGLEALVRVQQIFSKMDDLNAGDADAVDEALDAVICQSDPTVESDPTVDSGPTVVERVGNRGSYLAAFVRAFHGDTNAAPDFLRGNTGPQVVSIDDSEWPEMQDAFSAVAENIGNAQEIEADRTLLVQATARARIEHAGRPEGFQQATHLLVDLAWWTGVAVNALLERPEKEPIPAAYRDGETNDGAPLSSAYCKAQYNLTGSKLSRSGSGRKFKGHGQGHFHRFKDVQRLIQNRPSE